MSGGANHDFSFCSGATPGNHPSDCSPIFSLIRSSFFLGLEGACTPSFPSSFDVRGIPSPLTAGLAPGVAHPSFFPSPVGRWRYFSSALCKKNSFPLRREKTTGFFFPFPRGSSPPLFSLFPFGGPFPSQANYTPKLLAPPLFSQIPNSFFSSQRTSQRVGT